jgi:prepilin-type N-terminal cleavage/methylation domain-containing protein
MREKKDRGLTLIETLVVVALVSVMATLSLGSWSAMGERLFVLRMRQQLMHDLHAARVLALERQITLSVNRIPDCAWGSTQMQDWSCGWRVIAAPPASLSTPQLLIHTRVERPMRLLAFPAAPLHINAQGDLVGVGLRWQFKLSHNDASTWLICVNAASRMRAVNAASCA